MIMFYLLPVECIADCDVIVGQQFIHDAVLLSTVDPNERLLLQDSTPDDHLALSALASDSGEASPDQRSLFNTLRQPPIIDPDIDTVQAILANSPESITMPQIWQLLEILSRRTGIPE